MSMYRVLCQSFLDQLGDEIDAWVTDGAGTLIAARTRGEPPAAAEADGTACRLPLAGAAGEAWYLVADGKHRHALPVLHAALEAALLALAQVGARSAEERLVEQLLTPGRAAGHESPAVANSLRIAGLDATLPRAVILIDFEERANRYFNIHFDLGYDASAQKAKEDVLQVLRTNRYITKQDLIAEHGRSQIVIVKSFHEKTDKGKVYHALDRITQSIVADIETSRVLSVRAAYGHICEDPAFLRQSYDQAQLIIRLGTTFLGRYGFFSYEDLLVEHITHSLPAPLVEKTLLPIADKLMNGEAGGPELLHILETYIDLNFNLNETARRLYLHRNTVAGKLARFKKVTGLHPGDDYRHSLITKLLAAWLRMNSTKNR